MYMEATWSFEMYGEFHVIPDLFFFFNIYSACSITVSNTACTVDILHNYLSSKNSYFFYIQVCRRELFFL